MPMVTGNREERSSGTEVSTTSRRGTRPQTGYMPLQPFATTTVIGKLV